MSDNTHSDEDGYISDPYSDIDDNYNFPQDDDDVVEFGWQDERKISGRRKKAQQAAKKKAKPGSFGMHSFHNCILLLHFASEWAVAM